MAYWGKQIGACAKARRIFAEMEGAPRKEMLDACIAAGIRRATAETQHFLWKHRNDAPRVVRRRNSDGSSTLTRA